MAKVNVCGYEYVPKLAVIVTSCTDGADPCAAVRVIPVLVVDHVTSVIVG